LSHRKDHFHLYCGALAAIVATGCTSWRYETRPVPAPFDGRALREIRLYLRTGETIYVYDVELKEDSLFGYDRPSAQPGATRLAVATRDVREIAVRKGDVFKTGAAIVVGTFAVGTFLAVMACASLTAG
jgi:hypothetical protein